MPKLDDYDDSHASQPISQNAQASIGNKLANGGSFAPSTGTNSFSTGQSAFNTTPTTSAFGTTSTFNGGTSTFGGTGTTGGFGSTSFGNSNAGFGSTTGLSPNQSSGGAMQEGGVAAIETSQGFGDFINSKWRPMMAVIYMITCSTDFVIFPVLWSVLQAVSHGQVTSQWQPLTLQGAGLYHIAMGAVLGLAAYGRSQEKIAGKA